MTLLLASCTEDFKDWANPQSNAQADIVAFGNGSVAAVDVIDLAEIPEGNDVVKVCNITAPSTSDTTYKPEYIIYLNDNAFDLNAA